MGICCRGTVQTIKAAGMMVLDMGMIAFLILSGLVLWPCYALFG